MLNALCPALMSLPKEPQSPSFGRCRGNILLTQVGRGSSTWIKAAEKLSIAVAEVTETQKPKLINDLVPLQTVVFRKESLLRNLFSSCHKKQPAHAHIPGARSQLQPQGGSTRAELHSSERRRLRKQISLLAPITWFDAILS